MDERLPDPTHVQPRDVHGQLLRIVNLQRPTDLLFRPYQEVMADFRGVQVVAFDEVECHLHRRHSELVRSHEHYRQA